MGILNWRPAVTVREECKELVDECQLPSRPRQRVSVVFYLGGSCNLVLDLVVHAVYTPVLLQLLHCFQLLSLFVVAAVSVSTVRDGLYSVGRWQESVVWWHGYGTNFIRFPYDLTWIAIQVIFLLRSTHIKFYCGLLPQQWKLLETFI